MQDDLDILNLEENPSYGQNAAAALRKELNIPDIGGAGSKTVPHMPKKGRRKQHHEERNLPPATVEFREVSVRAWISNYALIKLWDVIVHP